MIGARLESGALAANDADALAAADTILAAARPENIWHAEGLTGADGKPFAGYGSFTNAASRLDQAYAKASTSKARKRVAEYMGRVEAKDENGISIKQQSGYHKMFVTLTMPTLIGFGFKRTLDFFDDASRRFRQCKLFRDKVRGGVRGVEFTLGDQRCDKHIRLKTKWKDCRSCADCRAFVWAFDTHGYHFHAHYVLWSKKLDWEELGEAWTKSLQATAEEFGVELVIGTSHGRVLVDTRKVTERGNRRDSISETGAIDEACKYITKGSDFEKIPESELVEINSALAGRRMIEPLGEANTRKGSTAARKDAAGQKHNLDEPVIVESSPLTDEYDSELESLRKYGARMIRAGKRARWLETLRQVYAARADYRKVQLAERYPNAKFITLAGESFPSNAPVITRDNWEADFDAHIARYKVDDVCGIPVNPIGQGQMGLCLV
jgi:hypothetical protein